MLNMLRVLNHILFPNVIVNLNTLSMCLHILFILIKYYIFLLVIMDSN